MNAKTTGLTSNEQTAVTSGGLPDQGQPSRQHEAAPVCPFPLYTVDEGGIYQISDELEAIRQNKREATTVPVEQIRHFAGDSNAEERVTELAQSVAQRPRAGLMAEMDNDDRYLHYQGAKVGEEATRLEQEYLARPDYIMKPHRKAGLKSMSRLKASGLILAMTLFLLLGAWTGTSEVALLYQNLSIINPLESGEVDFAAMYSNDPQPGVGSAVETQKPSVLEDTNLFISIAGFAGLFALAKWLNLLQVVPLNKLKSLPRGFTAKIKWLFSRQGQIAIVQLGLIAAAITLNVRIGFELDRSALDLESKPPIPAAVAYTLIACSLAFSTYAFLYWAKQIFDRLCGVREVLDSIKLAIGDRLAKTQLVLGSIVSVQSCFAGLRSDQRAFEESYVADCLSVLAGIQAEQRQAAEFANEAAKQAAATARMQALNPSTN